MTRIAPILVVGPAPDVTQQIASALESGGYDHATFDDAHAALTWVRENGAPSAMVVDTDPKGMSRLAFVAAIRVHTRTHVPVTYVSRKKLKLERLEDGTRVFAVPVDRNKLLAEVRRIIDDAERTKGTHPGEAGWASGWESDEADDR